MGYAHQSKLRLSFIKAQIASISWGAIVFVGIAFVIFKFVLIIGIVPSGSMEPSIAAGSVFIGTHLPVNSCKNLQRGDIITFVKSDISNETLLKRIIGLPGDTVHISGAVYVNGERLDESAYLPSDTCTAPGPTSEFVVPDGSYLVLGDNRANSYDSRFWTVYPFVNDTDVIGQIWWSCRIPIWNTTASQQTRFINLAITLVVLFLSYLFLLWKFLREYRSGTAKQQKEQGSISLLLSCTFVYVALNAKLIVLYINGVL